MASVVLLRVIITNEIRQETKIIIGVIILIIKIGMWPFHIWYIKVLSELKMKRKPFLMIVTWQKIIPIVILMTITKIQRQEIIIIIVVNIIAIIIIMKKKTSIKSIIILSSGFNNSMIMASSLRMSLILIFIRAYSISIILALKIVIKMKKKRINPKKQILGEAIITANLGGIPPFLLFFGKIIVIKNLMIINIIELRFSIIVIICGFIYHYYWAMSPILIERVRKTQLSMKRKIRGMSTTLLIISITGAILILALGLTKRVYLDRVKIKNL